MNREQEFQKIKELIKNHYGSADCGFFRFKNFVGDSMITIYRGEYFTLDICYYYSYFELFGATDEEFKELSKYYDSLEIDEDYEESEEN